jgi:hypothetical protein
VVGSDVLYDRVRDERLRSVVVMAGARLRFRTDADTRLVVGTIQVRERGDLVVGEPADPVAADARAEIVISGEPLDPTIDPEGYAIGLLGLGTVRTQGAERTPFARLARAPSSGDGDLVFASAVHGWRAGDRLALPDTRSFAASVPNREASQHEVARVATVSTDGLRVELDEPLRYAHDGGRDADGVTRFPPHVANLERNVVIRSGDPGRRRGHVLLVERADVQLRDTALRGFGRTLTAPIVDARVAAAGAPAAPGANQSGRQPLRLLRVRGPEGSAPGAPRFTLERVVVDGDGADGAMVLLHGPRRLFDPHEFVQCVRHRPSPWPCSPREAAGSGISPSRIR